MWDYIFFFVSSYFMFSRRALAQGLGCPAALGSLEVGERARGGWVVSLGRV